jgi:prevent-host-death family protein
MRTYVLVLPNDNNSKGTVAELAVQLQATRLGVGVYRPLNEHSRADLVFELAGRFWRVQCKWGRLAESGEVVQVRVGGSRIATTGRIHRTYNEREVDLLAVYCGELERSYLLPPEVFVGRHALQLRLAPSRNKQRACINLADDFAFEGAIAQLGERRAGSAKVAGSSPASSTESQPPAGRPAVVVGANAFRDKLGQWMDRVASGEEVIITRHGRPRIVMAPAVPGAEAVAVTELASRIMTSRDMPPTRG